MTREFYEELGELIKKHKLTLVTGSNDGLEPFTKKFEGRMFFITDGTPNMALRGCEKMMFEASHTIILKKIRNDID